MSLSFPGAMVGVKRRKALGFIVLGLAVGLWAAPLFGQMSEADETKALQIQIAHDPELRKHPHLQEFVRDIVPLRQPSLREGDPSLARFLKDAMQTDDADQPYLRLSAQEVNAFFEACVADKLTMVRAIALVSRVVNWSDMVLAIDGRDIDAALKAQGLKVGLSLPMEHAVMFAYVPHKGSQAPFLCKFFAVYDRAFAYSYDKDVMEESIVIGADGGPRLGTRKVMEGREASGTLYMVDSEVRYQGSTAGFYNIKGVTLAGWKGVAFGAVDAMFVEGDTLTIKGTHWLARNVGGFELPEQWRRVGIHP